MPTRTSLIAPLLALVVLGCSAPSDRDVLARDAGCSVRVIVRFAGERDKAVLAEVERAIAIALDPLGAVTSDLGVYMLRATGSSDACAAAIERLRRDERVVFVGLDERRGIHEPSKVAPK